MVAGGLAILAGAALWRLAIEFERAWLRSYEGPLLGEDALSEDRGGMPQAPPIGEAANAHRRWVTEHHPRAARRATRAAGSLHAA
ncbi:MAG: hypothetical protein ACLP1Q_20225 [Solirubrobacteraceae bacterium]